MTTAQLELASKMGEYGEQGGRLKVTNLTDCYNYCIGEINLMCFLCQNVISLVLFNETIFVAKHRSV